MAVKEYKTITEIVGPLMLVEKVEGVKFDELVEIRLADGTKKFGRVLEIDNDVAVVQLFEGSQGIKIDDAKAVFLGHGIELSLSPDILGRVFDGMGSPIDGKGNIIADVKRDINGQPLNPVAEIIQMNLFKLEFQQLMA